MESEKVSLTLDDWSLLLPAEEYILGKSKIYIKPLGLEMLAKVMSSLQSILEDWKDVLIENTNVSPKKKNKSVTEQILLYFPKISSLIQEHGISIISDMSGIVEDDVKRLPPKEAMGLFSKCLEINITSQEGLEKNFKGLADQIVKLNVGSQALK